MKKILSLKSLGVGLGLGLATLPLAVSASTFNVAQKPANSTNRTSRNVEEFIIRGNEPFWNVTVTRKGIFYATPEIKNMMLSPYVAPQAAEGRLLDTVRVYRLRGKGNNMLIINKVDACNDTMSDKEYPYMATLIIGNTVRSGCAERQ